MISTTFDRPVAYNTRSRTSASDNMALSDKPPTLFPDGHETFKDRRPPCDRDEDTVFVDRTRFEHVVPTRQVPESCVPSAFNRHTPKADIWLLHFKRYADYRQMKAAGVTAAFPLFLRDSAIEWYENLPEAIKTDVSELMDSFKRFFCKSPLDTLFDAVSFHPYPATYGDSS